MKLIMTLLVKDEEDILRDNIEFHLNSGVDFIIATDNRSSDKTGEILRAYERMGVLKYIYEPSPYCRQHEFVTRMARMAAEEYAADWVINNDADEFWWTDSGDLKAAIDSATDHPDVLIVQRQDMVSVPGIRENQVFYERMIRRRAVSTNAFSKPLPPKVMHKADPKIFVMIGNHLVKSIEEKKTRDIDNILIFHFPHRSYQQLVARATKGYKSWKRNILFFNASQTYSVYQELYERGELRNYYDDFCGAGLDLERLENQGFVEELRLRDRLREIAESRLLDDEELESLKPGSLQYSIKMIQDLFSFVLENTKLQFQVVKNKLKQL